MTIEERLAQLEAGNQALQADNQRLRARLVELETANTELARRLAATSQTSHRPPSTDGLRKPRPAVPRQPGQRPPGKQPGQPGSTLAHVAEPDERLTHTPTACKECGGSLQGAPVVGAVVRQVHDVPDRLGLWVREHVAEQRVCGCGHVTSAAFPTGVGAPAQYGPGVRALGVYLRAAQHLPVERAARLLAELLGAPVSTGTLAGLLGEAAGRLDGFAARAREQLTAAPVAHADETGARVQGSLHWVHSVSTGQWTWQSVHQRRGRDGIDANGALPGYQGVLVHDGWRPYQAYGTATHALCGAHLVRELAAVAEAPGQQWADRMRRLLLEACEQTHRAREVGQGRLDPGVLAGIDRCYRQLLAEGLAANPAARLAPGARRRHKRPQATNLLVRLTDQQAQVLRFTQDLRVPFTNNQAERDVRMVKVQQKISGGWRTQAGASAFCTVRSYLSTARKHRVSQLGVLRSLFQGQPWLPAPPE